MAWSVAICLVLVLSAVLTFRRSDGVRHRVIAGALLVAAVVFFWVSGVMEATVAKGGY